MQVSQPCRDINAQPGTVLVSVGQKLVNKTLTPLPPGWDGSEACVLCYLPRLHNGTGPQLPTMGACLITLHPFTTCLPSLSHVPTPPLALPGITYPWDSFWGTPMQGPRTTKPPRAISSPPLPVALWKEVLPAARRKKQSPAYPFQELVPKGGRLEKTQKAKTNHIMLLGPTCPLFKAGGMKFSHIKF